MNNVFVTRMPSGISGTVQRTDAATIEHCLLDTVNVPAAYGIPVKMVGGKIRALTATTDTVYGFLCRPYPSQQTSGGMNASAGAGAPSGGTVCDVLRRGYINTVIAGGTAAFNGAVQIDAAAFGASATAGTPPATCKNITSGC